MRINFKNENLEVNDVVSFNRFYQNANREMLELIFDSSVSLDNLISLFNTKENVASFTVNKDETEVVYVDYVIVVSISREAVTFANETNTSPAQIGHQVKVVLAQQNYTEKLLEKLVLDS